MSTIDVSSVLSQIRALNAQASARPQMASPAAASTTEAADPSGGFGGLVAQGLSQVAGVQAEAGKLQQAFELGDPSTDLASVMVATARAQVSFRAMVEVRNRAVSAYQDVMNMPL